MSSPQVDFGATVVEVELSRDYDPAAARLPGMALGTHRLAGPCGGTVAGWYAAGARHARLAHPVDLCADADARAARSLLLIRELTARGIAVDWTARCRDGCHGGDLFTHLCPPSRLDGDATGTVAARWRAAFFLGRCVYRRGPGFVEVRDRRSGALEVVTIDEPGHLAAIATLAEGVAATAVPADVRRDLVGAHLVAEQAGHLWWLPTRAHRWPFPALIV